MWTGMPRIVCLKSTYNNKYLRYKSDDAHTHGLLQFAGDNVTDPYAQFEVEKAKNWPDLIHIKSRYNNKYLVRWSPSHNWISATANEPDEDQTKWSCTLFNVFMQFNRGTDHMRISLVHFQLGNYYLRLSPRSDATNPFKSCLFAESNMADCENYLDVLTVVDWESLFTLPKRVAIRADGDEYLGAVTFDGQPGLQFSFVDANDPKVAHQLFSSPDGTIYVKSEYFDKFWRVGDDDWVVVDAEDPQGKNIAATMFRLTPIDVNVVALINMKPTTFITRYSTNGRESSLATKTTSIDRFARLTLVDLDK